MMETEYDEWGDKEDLDMNERMVRATEKAGVWNLVLGIVVLVTGVATGVLMILNAVRLWKAGTGLGL
ncbi:MAG: hypothetical protein LUD16_01065 [Lachnospiraceae bacterium]|nr:hypothetical protein [Lachnospiraceae bacterium]